MADMELVIKIPDKTYIHLRNGGNIGASLLIENAIKNGTPLPNGRTIDADELLKRIAEKCKTPSLSEDTVNGLCGATAIIYDMLIESGQEK